MADNTEIELYPSRCPGTSECDLSKFHNMIGVDEFVARGFFQRSPYLAAYLWEYRHGNVRVLHPYDFPFLVEGRFTEFVEEKIRIKPRSSPPKSRSSEDRYGIRLGKRIGFDCFLPFFYPCLIGRRTTPCKKENRYKKNRQNDPA
jgi:hypothetical protein